MPGLPAEVLEGLDEVYVPIVIDFTITQVPEGGAPEEIRREWVGLSLPVREQNALGLGPRYFDLLTGQMRDNPSSVGISGIEAVDALYRAGKIEASNFWYPYHLGLFTFRAYEGRFDHLRD